jgi:hypothetical protein
MPAALSISPEMIQQIRNEVNTANRGERSLIVDEFARQLNCSVATLWRKINITKGKKTANRERTVDDEIIMKLCHLKVAAGQSGRAKRYLTDDETIRIAEQIGIIQEGELSVSWWKHRRAELGWNTPRAYNAYEDDYVNQTQFIDFSVSEYFGVERSEGDDYVLKVLGKNAANPYKNKPDESKLKLWLCSNVETYSRATIFRYIPSPGESLTMASDFLNFCWYREDEALPVLNLPDVLKMDQGPVYKSNDFRNNIEELLDVHVVPTSSKSDREAAHQSGGKVERRFRTIWRQESAWGFILERKGINRIMLSELNEMAYEYCIELAHKSHPRRRNQTILATYQQGLQRRNMLYNQNEIDRPNRSLDLDMTYVLWKQMKRTPDATGHISIDNELYVVEDRRFDLQPIRVLVGRHGIKGMGVDPSNGQTITFSIRKFDADNAPAQKPAETMRQTAAKMEVDADFSKVSVLKQAHAAQVDETSVRLIGTKATPIRPKSEYQSQQKPDLLDYDSARSYLCDLLGMKYNDIPEEIRDLVEMAHQQQKLTKAMLNSFAKVVNA